MNEEEKQALQELKVLVGLAEYNKLSYKENSLELRQVMMEELTYTLYVELDGEDIDGYKPFDYFRINYCPICR